jgi:hypothetical protein
MLHGDRPGERREAGLGTACTGRGRTAPDARSGFNGEVVELAGLLTSGQATALESRAHARGMTVAQLLRCLIRECLAHPAAGVPRLSTRAGGLS